LPPVRPPAGYGADVGRPAAPTPDSIARDAIMQVLERYRMAYEQRNLDGLKQVYPTAPQNYINGLRYAFKDYKSLEYTFTADPEFLHVDPALGMATVKRPTLSKPEYKGPGSPPLKQVHTFTMKRENDAWNIVDLKSVLAK
jgi:hypothetical protein